MKEITKNELKMRRGFVNECCEMSKTPKLMSGNQNGNVHKIVGTI